MKSVGETMAIGRTFKESFQKALRGLEVGSFGFGCDSKDLWDTSEQPSIEDIRAKLATPNADRVWYLRYAFKAGLSINDIHELSGIDRWFLDHLLEIIETEEELRKFDSIGKLDTTLLKKASSLDFRIDSCLIYFNAENWKSERSASGWHRCDLQIGRHVCG